MPHDHNPTREGVVAGIIGATGVAIWCLIADLIWHHAPLFTPKVLGTALFSVFGQTNADPTLLHVAVFAVVHYAIFILFGIIAARVVHKAEEEPSVLVVSTLMFIIFELGVTGVAAIMAETRLHGMAWYLVAIGNLIAAVLMGLYLWRTHPALRQEFSHALGGEE